MSQSSLKDTWKDTWNSPVKRAQIIFSTSVMLVFVFMLPFFFGFIEKRHGIVLHDWLLAQVPAYNVSVPIFTIIWGMILLILIRAVYNPSIYITYCWSLMFVFIARMVCILMVPLDPPAGLIPLTDPLTGVFYGHAVITKDLFFSGHTATLTLIVLCLEKRTDKIIAFIATIIVAVLLLVQHIHYTVDVVTAPVVVYGFYNLTRYLFYRNKQYYRKKQHQKILAKVYSASGR